MTPGVGPESEDTRTYLQPLRRRSFRIGGYVLVVMALLVFAAGSWEGVYFLGMGLIFLAVARSRVVLSEAARDRAAGD